MDSGVGWNDEQESIGSERPLSRVILGGPGTPDPGPPERRAQGFFGGKEALEKSWPFKNVTAFPLFQ
jgi:hypothetical protein